ncbi:MAG: glycosyl hydrolase [Sedimentisphaeraceae bacterium JB056]
MQNSLVREKFTCPDAALRGKLFWSWNGDLEKDELLRQIKIMKEMGFGGFFMHSRSGLGTEYLGEKWFELINACADEGEKEGMEAWLYDEDRWPSGSAGGLATKEGKYRMKYIRCRTYKNGQYKWDSDDIAVFACKLDDLAFSNCRRIADETELAKAVEEDILAFNIEEMKCDSFYNGQTYLDTMNADAVNHFIELTHEKYKTHCGDKFGKSIKGMFTDEPHRGMIMSTVYNGDSPEWVVPYTPALFDEFKAAFGYDLIERLPELFLLKDGEKVSQVKWHYIEIVERLFLANFAKLTYDWCRDNDLLLTGHILHEDTLTTQTIPCGSVMRYYEYMDYPGIDLLTETNRNYWIVKQLTSAARQLGKKWLLSELYGCSGWQMTLQNYKETGDWQSLFGINLRCPHLSWYTMKGQAKRDYPASIMHQSGWYKEFEAVETYFSRLQLMLMQGEQECEVLVINPVESVWCRIYPGWTSAFSPKDEEIIKIEKSHAALFGWLASSGIDFDYGDEAMLAEMASVENGSSLKVGQASYSTVVVPPLTTMRSSTLEMLNKFAAAGGKVIFAGTPAPYIDALPSQNALLLAESCPQCKFEKEPLVSEILGSIDIPVELKTNGSCDQIFSQIRKDGSKLIITLMNVSVTESFEDVVVRVKHTGSPQIWDCRTGDISGAEFERDGEFIEITADFDPAREMVIVVSDEKLDDNSSQPEELCCCEISQKELSGPFAYSLNEPNVCVLDTAKFKINDGDWQDELEVLKIDRKIREYMGLDKRSGQMIQPWCRDKSLDTTEHIALEFGFSINTMPTEDLILVIEEPHKFDIYLNNDKLESKPLEGFWLDICFSKLSLPLSMLKNGSNTIRIETDYSNSRDIESLYLLGQFGVEIDGTEKALISLPQTLEIGDITAQALPFYSGKIKYIIPEEIASQLSKDSCISLPQIGAACAKITDAKDAEKLMVFKPYSTTLDDLDIGSGLAIELVLGRRNTFGPLHLDRPDSTDGFGFRKWFGPDEFETTGDLWSDDYMLIEQGLLKKPVIYG